jgi:hypothetical protein
MAAALDKRIETFNKNEIKQFTVKKPVKNSLRVVPDRQNKKKVISLFLDMAGTEDSLLRSVYGLAEKLKGFAESLRS